MGVVPDCGVCSPFRFVQTALWLFRIILAGKRNDNLGGQSSNAHNVLEDAFLYSLGKLATGYLCKLQLTTVQSGFKWWGENPEKAPNPARQLWSLGHWWSLVVTGQVSGQQVGYLPLLSIL